MIKSLNMTKEMSMAKGNLEERLKAHPQLLERIEARLNVVEDSGAENEQADLAEQRVITVGFSTFQLSSGKKTSPQTLYWYTSFGTIELKEQLFSQGKGKALIRPFSQSARVFCRSYSTPLQKIITDFGADVPLGRIPKKLLEHYGINVPVSSASENHPRSCR